MKTDIVIPVHNRRDVTVRCLANLHDLGVFAWAGVVVVDDGSTDGTAETIRTRFPEVILLTGDGNLWWTGAIVKGMTHALARGAELIFWLNDDCVPQAGTLELLASHAAARQGVAVGQAFTPSGFCYGGFRRTLTGVRAIPVERGEVVACDTFNGNCVCFPRALIEQVGLPDARHFPHNGGDSDYGFRLRELHLPVEVLGDATCRNDDNLSFASKSWLLSDVPLWKMLANIRSPKSSMNIAVNFHHLWRHWGVVGLGKFCLDYLKFFSFFMVRLVVPRKWLLSLVGSRSRAWQSENFHRV